MYKCVCVADFSSFHKQTFQIDTYGEKGKNMEPREGLHYHMYNYGIKCASEHFKSFFFFFFQRLHKCKVSENIQETFCYIFIAIVLSFS